MGQSDKKDDGQTKIIDGDNLNTKNYMNQENAKGGILSMSKNKNCKSMQLSKITKYIIEI